MFLTLKSRSDDMLLTGGFNPRSMAVTKIKESR